MNTIENQLAELYIGCEETDSRIRTAYELGQRQGRVTDRDNVRRCAQIDTTSKLLNALMVTQGIDIQAALIALRIPRAERSTYVKISARKRK